MLLLAQPAQNEISIKNSKFLAEATPVDSAEAARDVLRSKKNAYPDATHVVHAFVTGPQANVMGCSDDGEPAGTAGRPALEVLKNCGITNIMVTVTRWFGGTKLGTGGLVRAYTQSVQDVLKSCVTSELIEMASVSFQIPYSIYETVKRQFSEWEITDVSEEFGDQISICGRLPVVHFASLETFIFNITKGKATVSRGGDTT